MNPVAVSLGARCVLIAPDLIDASASSLWSGDHPLPLSGEAASILDLIEDCSVLVHLVGHSCCGGVGLHDAARRPTFIATLSLYVPSAFHLLRPAGSGARPFFVSFRLRPGLSNEISSAVPTIKLIHPRRMLPLSVAMCWQARPNRSPMSSMTALGNLSSQLAS